MKLKPLADRVVLKQNEAEERTGGLVDGNEVTMIVTPGQKVLVGKYSGSKVKLEEQEYTIVRQSDILAVIE